MKLRQPPVVALLAVLVFSPVLAAAAVGPTAGAPPPEELCGVCGPEFEAEAADAGVALSVEHSAATIAVGQDGTGHWHARVRIDETSATRLAENATLREHLVRETYAHGRTVVDDPRDLRTSVENGTLVVDFDVPKAAHRSLGGVVLVDLLDPRTRRAAIRVDADELRITGPDGTAVTRSPQRSTVEDGSVVWQPDEGGVGLHGDTRLAFAPTNGPLAQSATTVAIVAFGLTLVESTVFLLAAIPAAGLALGLVALHRWHDTLPPVDSGRAATWLVGVGTAGATVGALSWTFALFVDSAVAGTVTVFAAMSALVAAGILLLDRPSPRATLAWTVASALVVTAAASLVSVVAFRTALLSVPAVCFLPLGRAQGRDAPVTWLVTGALLLAPIGAAAIVHPPRIPLFALLWSLFTTVPWAGATLLCGFPLYLAGRGSAAVSGGDTTEHSSGASAD